MQAMTQPMEFVHPPLGETITAIGGHYAFTKEDRIAFGNREILYLVGYGVVDTSCCGTGGCIYALVPGYVLAFHTETAPANGQAISVIEPVDEKMRKAVVAALKEKEGVTQVHFLTPQGDTKVLF